MTFDSHHEPLMVSIGGHEMPALAVVNFDCLSLYT